MDGEWDAWAGRPFDEDASEDDDETTTTPATSMLGMRPPASGSARPPSSITLSIEVFSSRKETLPSSFLFPGFTQAGPHHGVPGRLSRSLLLSRHSHVRHL